MHECAHDESCSAGWRTAPVSCSLFYRRVPYVFNYFPPEADPPLAEFFARARNSLNAASGFSMTKYLCVSTSIGLRPRISAVATPCRLRKLLMAFLSYDVSAIRAEFAPLLESSLIFDVFEMATSAPSASLVLGAAKVSLSTRTISLSLAFRESTESRAPVR